MGRYVRCLYGNVIVSFRSYPKFRSTDKSNDYREKGVARDKEALE